MSTSTYLQLDKIKGESADDAHKQWIELFSFSHGLSQPISGQSGTGGRASSRADFQSFSVAKSFDSASCDLHLYCAAGTHIANATVEICQESGDKIVYLQYKFVNLMVESVSVSGGGSERPMENASFVYDQVTWTYTPVTDEGKAGTKVDRTWSLAQNKSM